MASTILKMMALERAPDRAWIPSCDVNRRPFRLLSTSGQHLPDGFPAQITSKMAWSGPTFQFDDGTFLNLLPSHIHELEAAYEHFKALNLPTEKLSCEKFPLQKLGPILKGLAKHLYDGSGFFIVRGLDPKYSAEANMIMYVGMSCYIGESRGRQDEYGNMILHLTDLGSAAAPENERQAPYSSVGQPFHTDTGSIIAMHTLGEAAHGGESKLVSSAKIYNEIARTRPDVIHLLTKDDWVFDRFGQEPPYWTRPLLFHEDSKIILLFSRRPLVGSFTSPRSNGIPRLSDEQVEALNLVHFVAEENALTLKFEKGDVLFWNNLGLLHCRSGFTDSSEHKRHLIRLWLHDEKNMWSVPKELRGLWDESYNHAGRPQLWPVNPIMDREYISTQQRSSGHA